MRGTLALAIQELAGHPDLSTTQRYTHLSPAAIEGAIRLLDQGKLELRHRQQPDRVGHLLLCAEGPSGSQGGLRQRLSHAPFR